MQQCTTCSIKNFHSDVSTFTNLNEVSYQTSLQTDRKAAHGKFEFKLSLKLWLVIRGWSFSVFVWNHSQVITDQILLTLTIIVQHLCTFFFLKILIIYFKKSLLNNFFYKTGRTAFAIIKRLFWRQFFSFNAIML